MKVQPHFCLRKPFRGSPPIVFNCRVMLGGEIYYRAIGRPWGPAADFIVIVKFD